MALSGLSDLCRVTSVLALLHGSAETNVTFSLCQGFTESTQEMSQVPSAAGMMFIGNDHRRRGVTKPGRVCMWTCL